MTPFPLDFYIAGVQKAATSALADKLGAHPRICCSAPKELHLFDDETRDWSLPALPDLSAHFEGYVAGQLRGEATPIYMYWPNAIERMAACNPAARIIIGLRHPAWRALSHWRMETTRGTETFSFANAVSSEGRARAVPVHRIFSYVERGFYAPQIRRVLAHFPRENVFFYKMEDLWHEEDALLTAVFGFLGVEARLPRPAREKYVVSVDSRGLTDRPDAGLSELSKLYAADMHETMELTGLDLAAWIDGSYNERFLQSAVALLENMKDLQ